MRDFLIRLSVMGLLALFAVAVLTACAAQEEGGHGVKEETKEETGHGAKGKTGQVIEFDANPEYVGAAKCKDCHWREHDTWKHTLHSKMMQEANDFTVIGDFNKINSYSVKVNRKSPKLAGTTMLTRMFKKDGKYYINTIGPDWTDHDYEVTAVLGINRKQNYLTRMSNGDMYLLPVKWDATKNEWSDYYGLKDHFPGEGDYWSDRTRLWQYKCAGCHVTGLQVNYEQTTDSFNTAWKDMGIGCESCHGPGSNHLKAAKTYFDYEQETIINPAKLPWRLRAMVCGQCHNKGVSIAKVPHKDKGFPVKYSYAEGFKPGMALNLYYDSDSKGASGDETEHHQQYNEWTESEHATAGIMCTTCHNVHQAGIHKQPNKAQTTMPGGTLCTSCHQAQNKRAAHRIHTYGSCIACHMPRLSGPEHSHTFKFVSPELSLRAGGVKEKPNSCSGCHYHKNTPLINLVEFLDAAKKKDMPKPFSAHRSR